MTQTALDFDPPTDPVRDALLRLRQQVEAEYGGESALFARFLGFHASNPGFLDLLLRYADELLAVGARRAGVSALFERARWHDLVEVQSDTGLRCNNSYRSFYSRLLILLRPTLARVLETRRLGPARSAQIP